MQMYLERDSNQNKGITNKHAPSYSQMFYGVCITGNLKYHFEPVCRKE